MPGNVINGAKEHVNVESGFCTDHFSFGLHSLSTAVGQKEIKFIETFHLQTAVVYVVFHLSAFRRC